MPRRPRSADPVKGDHLLRCLPVA